MTDSELVKALRCCGQVRDDCDPNCPMLNNDDVEQCCSAIMLDAADAIERYGMFRGWHPYPQDKPMRSVFYLVLFRATYGKSTRQAVLRWDMVFNEWETKPFTRFEPVGWMELPEVM